MRAVNRELGMGNRKSVLALRLSVPAFTYSLFPILHSLLAERAHV